MADFVASESEIRILTNEVAKFGLTTSAPKETTSSYFSFPNKSGHAVHSFPSQPTLNPARHLQRNTPQGNISLFEAPKESEFRKRFAYKKPLLMKNTPSPRTTEHTPNFPSTPVGGLRLKPGESTKLVENVLNSPGNADKTDCHQQSQPRSQQTPSITKRGRLPENFTTFDFVNLVLDEKTSRWDIERDEKNNKLYITYFKVPGNRSYTK